MTPKAQPNTHKRERRGSLSLPFRGVSVVVDVVSTARKPIRAPATRVAVPSASTASRKIDTTTPQHLLVLGKETRIRTPPIAPRRQVRTIQRRQVFLSLNSVSGVLNAVATSLTQVATLLITSSNTLVSVRFRDRAVRTLLTTETPDTGSREQGTPNQDATGV